MAYNAPSDKQTVECRAGIAVTTGSGNLQPVPPSLGQDSTFPQEANQISMFSGPMAGMHHQMRNSQPGYVNGNIARRYPEVICPPLPTQGHGMMQNLPTGTLPIPGQYNTPSHSGNVGVQGIFQGSNAPSGLPQLSFLQGYQGNMPMPVPMTDRAISQTPQAHLYPRSAMFQPNQTYNFAMPMMAPQPRQQGNQVGVKKGGSVYVPSNGNFDLLPGQYPQQHDAVIGNMPLPGQPAHMMQMPSTGPANPQLQDRGIMTTASGGFHMNGITSPVYAAPYVNGQQMALMPTHNAMMGAAGGLIPSNMSTASQPVQPFAAAPLQVPGNSSPASSNAAAMHPQIQPATPITPQVGQTIDPLNHSNSTHGSSGNRPTVMKPNNLQENLQRLPLNCNSGDLPAVQSQLTPSYNGALQQRMYSRGTQQGLTGLMQQSQTAIAAPRPLSNIHKDSTHPANKIRMLIDSLRAQSEPNKNNHVCSASIGNNGTPSQQNGNLQVRPASDVNEKSLTSLDIKQTRSQSNSLDSKQKSPRSKAPLDQSSRNQSTEKCLRSSRRSLPASTNSTATRTNFDHRIEHVLADLDKLQGPLEILSEEDVPAFIEEMKVAPVDPPAKEKECSKGLEQGAALPRSALAAEKEQDLTAEDVLMDCALVPADFDPQKNLRTCDSALSILNMDMIEPLENGQTPKTTARTLITTSSEEIEIKVSSQPASKNSSTNTAPLLSKDDDSQADHDMEITASDLNEMHGDQVVEEVTAKKPSYSFKAKNHTGSKELLMMSPSENKPSDHEICSKRSPLRESPQQACQTKSEIVAEAWEAYYNYDWAKMTKPDRRKRRRYCIDRKRLPPSERRLVKSMRNGDQPILFRRLTDDEVIEVSKLYPRQPRRKKGKKVRNRIVAQKGREQTRQTTEKLQKENEKLRSENSYLRANAANLIRTRAENAKLKARLDNLIQSNPGLVLASRESGKGAANQNEQRITGA